MFFTVSPVLGWAGHASSGSHPLGIISMPFTPPWCFPVSQEGGKELPDTPAADEQQPPKRWLHDFVYRELVKHFGKLQDEKDYINVRYYYY